MTTSAHLAAIVAGLAIVRIVRPEGIRFGIRQPGSRSSRFIREVGTAKYAREVARKLASA